MKFRPLLHTAALTAFLTAAVLSRLAATPLQLHPDNPHYFLFQDKPAVLVTSAEHYGAVLNLDFDFHRYLKALAADGLNLTRVFSGSYVEPEGAFNIARNTLAPASGRFIGPWLRSAQEGYAGGGNRFDLEQWDPAYFARLKDFVRTAEQLGIVVEYTLFCPMYEDPQWKLSPMNPANHINSVGNVDKHKVHTLDQSGGLLSVQEKLVRKVVSELRGHSNVILEICNEPYFGGVTPEWQDRIADVITDASREDAVPLLISRNIANGSEKITNPHPKVSVFNFHYASPPDAVPLNYALNRVLGDNETGFKGTADDPYRMEAWEFLLAGGALFNHLDYSFAVGHEDGSFAYPPSQPGGGNAGFRRQMKLLKDFMHSLPFLRMKPARELLRGSLPKEARCQILAEDGSVYAIYGKGFGNIPVQVNLPSGTYTAGWLKPVSGDRKPDITLEHAGNIFSIQPPPDWNEWALRLVRKD